MKLLFIPVIVWSAFAQACQSPLSAPVNHHLQFYYAGRYVAAEDASFTRSWDTLTITQLSRSQFSVARHVRSCWTIPEDRTSRRLVTVWIANYHEPSESLVLEGRKDSLSLNVEQLSELHFEQRIYQRLEK